MSGRGLKRPLKGSCRAAAGDSGLLRCDCSCVGAFVAVVEERERQARPSSSSEVSFQEEEVEEEVGHLLLEEGCVFEGYGIQRRWLGWSI